MASLRQIFQGKLHGDLLWNVGSLAILGVAGILQNVVILLFYDASVLGVFNQVFAIYIFFSQLAVVGVHFSALKYVAENVADPEMVSKVVCAALTLATGFALVAAALFWLIRNPVAAALQSPGVARGMAYATPGLFFFALNKVLLSVLNGEQRMKLYAFYQALRPLSFIATLVLAATLVFPGESLTLMFSVSEAILLAGLLFSIRRHLRRPFLWLSHHWLKEHFRFGTRSFLSGVMVELNTRVDVLMLGYVATDAVVGIYSFAAMLAEGFFQLLVVLRTNFNPILVQYLHSGRRTELHQFISKWKRFTYLMMVPLGALIIALYPVGLNMLQWLGVKDPAPGSWSVFAILMAGIIASAGYFPFINILLNAGRPGLHTVLMALIVLFNVVGNLWLIPIWLANGAALATALSFVFAAVLISYVARRALAVVI